MTLSLMPLSPMTKGPFGLLICLYQVNRIKYGLTKTLNVCLMSTSCPRSNFFIWIFVKTTILIGKTFPKIASVPYDPGQNFLQNGLFVPYDPVPYDTWPLYVPSKNWDRVGRDASRRPTHIRSRSHGSHGKWVPSHSVPSFWRYSQNYPRILVAIV